MTASTAARPGRRRRRLVAALFVAGILLAGCEHPGPVSLPPPDPGELERQLMEADRTFAEDAAQRGLEGWTAWFAADAARLEIGGEVVRGIEEIRKSDAALFADPSVRLTWAPTRAGVFGDGEVGFTTGPYRLLRVGDDSGQAVLSTGHYLSLWRRIEGRWQVILDTGVPDEERANES